MFRIIKNPFILLFLPLISALAISQTKNISPDSYQKDRDRMVKGIESYGFKNPEVLEIIRTVPRHQFVPKSEIWQAYEDHPVPIGHGQTISQPYIVAYMTDKALVGNERVLEIGTGSGYQAAILSHFYKEVFSVEIIKELAQEADEKLKRLGYKNIRIKNADGYYGWKEYAPFDAIMVTAAADQIPPPLIQQLKKEGRMIIPVGNIFQVQSLMLVMKKGDDKIQTMNLMPVRFVPLIHKTSS